MADLTNPAGRPPGGSAAQPVGRRPQSATLAALVVFVLFVAVTLGPSLFGLRVFAGMDLLQRALPWARVTPPSAPPVSIFVRDIVDFYLPAFEEARRRLLAGDWPSWSGAVAGGTPLGAIPSVPLLSPLSLPFLLLPTWLAVGYGQLFVVLTGAGGMYLFLRRLSAGRAAGLVGGLVYVTSGYMVAWTNWPQLRVGAFIPVLFWALERYVQVRGPRAVVPVALAVAGLLLGGFPAVAGLTLYAAAGYVLVRLLAQYRGSWRRLVTDGAGAVGGVVLGAGLAAVQLLPFAAYLGTLDLSYRSQQFFNTTPARYAATAVFPQAFFDNVFGPGTAYAREVNPVEVDTHVGAVALLLILLAVLRVDRVARPRGAVTYLIAVSVLSGWLIFVQGPLTDWMSVLPIFDGNPIGRIRAVLGLTAATLAGLGFDALVHRARSWTGRGPRREVVAVPAALAALGLLGWLVDRRQTPLLGSDVRREVVLVCLGTAVAGGLILAGRRWRAAAAGTVLIVPLLVGVQALGATQHFWPTTTRAQYYPATAAHEYLRTHLGGQRIAQTGEVLLPSTTTVYGLRLVGGHAFYNRSWSELLRAVEPGTFVAPTISTLPGSDLAAAGRPGLDRMAARYYVSSDAAPLPGLIVPNGPVAGVVGADAAVARIAAQPLRGIGVSLAGAVPSPSARLTVSVVAADGTDVASGERPVPGARTPGDVFVPLAAEDAGGRPGPFTVTVTLTDRLAAPGATTLLAAGDGPRLLVVSPADDGLSLEAVLDGVTIYRRDGALPRIRWAAQAQVMVDPTQRARSVAHVARPPDEVVLSGPGPAAAGLPADLRVQEDSGDTVRVTVDAAGGGYLVLADAIQADWAVDVDGRAGSIVAADHAFGAVYVPTGRHEVVFRYAPRGRTVGAVLSSAGVVALLGLALPTTLWRRRRRPRAGSTHPATGATTDAAQVEPVAAGRSGARSTR